MTCPRCNGTGYVLYYIRGIIGDCDGVCTGCLFFVMCFCYVSAIIGGGIGILMFYLLKTELDYFICKFIFYIITGFFFLYTIATIINGFQIPINIYLDIIFVGLSVGNYFVGNLFYKKSEKFINFLGGLYSFLQTGGLGFFICFLCCKANSGIKEFKYERRPLTICPLCDGHGVLEESKFKQYVRCSKCKKKCGYQRTTFLSHWGLCSSCSGSGYCLNYDKIEIK